MTNRGPAGGHSALLAGEQDLSFWRGRERPSARRHRKALPEVVFLDIHMPLADVFFAGLNLSVPRICPRSSCHRL